MGTRLTVVIRIVAAALALILASILARATATTARADTSVPSPSVGNTPSLPFVATSTAVGPAARTLVLSRTAGSPGDSLAMAGTGWDPAAPVAVWFAPGAGGVAPVALTSVTPNRAGGFSAVSTVPAVSPGPYLLAACQGCGDGTKAAGGCAGAPTQCADFAVQAAPSPSLGLVVPPRSVVHSVRPTAPRSVVRASGVPIGTVGSTAGRSSSIPAPLIVTIVGLLLVVFSALGWWMIRHRPDWPPPRARVRVERGYDWRPHQVREREQAAVPHRDIRVVVATDASPGPRVEEVAR